MQDVGSGWATIGLDGVFRVNAAGVFDARASFAPGSLLVERRDGDLRLLAAGGSEEVDTHPASRAAHVVSLPNTAVIPGLVNAHAHLDLTHIGPQPHDPSEGFVSWVNRIRSARHSDESEIEASVRLGIELARAGGTVAIGDIAGAPRGRLTLAPWRALRDSSLRGVSFLEVFGIGRSEAGATERLRGFLESNREIFGRRARVRPGLQPHAPNTVSRRLFTILAELAAEVGAPLSTHLAETPEEREFVMRGTGPQRRLLESLDLWDDAILDACGRHPVAHLEQFLASKPVVAHVNDATDEAIEILASTGAHVAYCPRASEYFGAADHFGPHRYRDMLNRGVNVALGTDSIVNLPAECRTLSILDEIRLLHARDETEPRVLLAMATVHGARALGLDPNLVGFADPGPILAPLGVQVRIGASSAGVLEDVLLSAHPPQFLFDQN